MTMVSREKVNFVSREEVEGSKNTVPEGTFIKLGNKWARSSGKNARYITMYIVKRAISN